MIEVPHLIRQRSYERAYELVHTFRDRLTLEDLILCVVVETAGPDAIGWDYARRLVGIWARVVEVRV